MAEPRQRNSPSSAGADPLSGKADERFCRVGRLLPGALSGAGLAGTGIIIGCIVAETYILSSDAAASPQKTPEGAV